MKSSKKSNEKGEHTFIHKNISKSPSGVKKYSTSPGVHHKKNAEVGKVCGVPPQLGDCNSDEGYILGTVSPMPPDVKPEDGKILYSSSKMKLHLFPMAKRFRRGLEKDGHNPYLELTISARKRISSVLKHLCNKWGISSTAMGELMLFPSKIASYNFCSSKRWTSSEVDILVGDVHAALGSPEIFCLRYGWFLLPPNTSSLSFPNRGCVETVCSGTLEDTSNAKNEVDETSKELELSNEKEISGIAVEQTIPSEPLNQVSHKNEDKVKDGNSSDELHKNEDSRSGTGISHTSLLWSDLSNISIGGLLSEASLQGRFNTENPKLGGSRLLSHSIASDSLDAFIEQLKHPQDLTTLSPDMPSSILDAESTCQSFAFSKPLPLNQDLPTFRQSALRGISDQNAAPESFKYPKSEECPKLLLDMQLVDLTEQRLTSYCFFDLELVLIEMVHALDQQGSNSVPVGIEVNAQGSVLRCNAVQEAKTDSLPCSLGVYNNENSLGLSSLKWNDSLGPFDLPLTARQIIKDDSLSIGGFVR